MQMQMVQQPMQMVQPMQMPGGYQQVNVVQQLYSGGDFQEGLCGCFSDCGICFKSLCCCCCQYAENIQLISNGHESYNAHCCLSYCGGCCLLNFAFRSRLRAKYNLEAKVCLDCFVCCCCSACGLAQDSREIRNRLGVGKAMN